ncbi:hypothetical protein OSB04_005204 [Centaurea solstitialis]|uniref:DNA topoisomerase (ATP-hydrolyzing) n=1 Tax=Centaurea solstitialis TaxID=347529 RepID=A0AA38WRA8_9ASTR|nr:hypothetical protein OSB04_005204 [Centaurea solstitialis]
MILVNGCEGIATGWSKNVPQYDPLYIIENIQLLLEKKNPKTMIPWYRGFTGMIEPQENKHIIITKGNAMIKEGTKKTVIIDELPIHIWTKKYKILLEKSKFIKVVQFLTLHMWFLAFSSLIGKLKFCRNTMIKMMILRKYVWRLSCLKIPRAHDKEWLLNKLKLTSKIGLSNMYLFNSEGVLKKYDDAEEILKVFVAVRLEYYKKRKDYRSICLVNDKNADLKNFLLDIKRSKIKMPTLNFEMH